MSERDLVPLDPNDPIVQTSETLATPTGMFVGPGVARAGAPGQVLTKRSGADFDTEWKDGGGGSGGGHTIQGADGVPVAQESVLEVRGMVLEEGAGKTIIKNRVHGVLDQLPTEAERAAVQAYTIDLTSAASPSHDTYINAAIAIVESSSLLQVEPGGYLVKEGFLVSGATDIRLDGAGTTIYTHPDHVAPIHPDYAYTGLNDYNSLGCTIENSSGVTLSNFNLVGNYLNTMEKSSYAFTLFVNNVDETLILGTHVSECKGGVMFNDASNSGFRNCSVQTRNFNYEVFYISRLTTTVAGADDIALKAFDEHGWSTAPTSRRSYKVKISSLGSGGSPDKFIWCRRESTSTTTWGSYSAWTTVEREIPLWAEAFYTLHSGGSEAVLVPGEVLARDPLLLDNGSPLTESTNYVDPRDSIYLNRPLISVAWKSRTGHTIGDEWEFEWLGTDPTMVYIAKGYTVPNPEWIASTLYHVNNIVNQSHNNPFICLVQHTSTTSFGNDFISGYWQIDPAFYSGTDCINNFVDNCDFGTTLGTDLNFFIKGQKNLTISNSRIPYLAVTCMTDFRLIDGTKMEGMELGWTNGVKVNNCFVSTGFFFYGGNRDTRIINTEFKNFGFASKQAGVENHAAAIRISTSAANSFVGETADLTITNNDFIIEFTDRVYYGVYWNSNTNPIAGKVSVTNNNVIGNYCVEVNDFLYDIIDKPASIQRYGGTITGSFTVKPLPGNKVILAHSLTADDLCIVRNTIVKLSGFTNTGNNGLDFSVLKLNANSMLLHGSVNKFNIEDVYAGPAGELYITVTGHGLSTGSTCSIEGMTGFTGLIGTVTVIGVDTLEIDNSSYAAGHAGGTIFDINGTDTCTNIYLPLQVVAGSNDTIYLEINAQTTEPVELIDTAVTPSWAGKIIIVKTGSTNFPGWETVALTKIAWDYGFPGMNLWTGESIILSAYYNADDGLFHIIPAADANIKHYAITSTGGQSNLVVGRSFLPALNGAYDNVIIGNRPLVNLISSLRNTIIGDYAGRSLADGGYNNIEGYKAGEGITTGSGNTVAGNRALGRNSGANDYSYGVTTGSNNVATGGGAGKDVANGTSNAIFVGIGCGTPQEDNSCEMYLDPVGVGRACLLYGKYDTGTPANSVLKTPGNFDAQSFTQNGSPLAIGRTYVTVTGNITLTSADSGKIFCHDNRFLSYAIILPTNPALGTYYTLKTLANGSNECCFEITAGTYSVQHPNGSYGVSPGNVYYIGTDRCITLIYTSNGFWDISEIGAHAITEHSGVGDAASKNVGSTAGMVCAGDDVDMRSGARTPIAHNQALSTITDVTASLAVVNNQAYDAQVSCSTYAIAMFTSTSEGDIGTSVTLAFNVEDQLPSAYYSLTGSALTVDVAGDYIFEFGFGSVGGATSMMFDLKFRKNGGNLFHRYFSATGAAGIYSQVFTSNKITLAADDVIDIQVKRLSGSAVGETWMLNDGWLKIRKV